MADIILDTLTLPGDLQWVDEYDDGSDLVAHEQAITVTGALIIQASAQQAGRSMTLQGRLESSKGFAAIPRSLVEDLRALASVPGAVYAITLADGREFHVMFRRDAGPAVSAVPLKHIVPPEPDDLYFPTIRLMMI